MAEDTIQNASDIPQPDRDEASDAACGLLAGGGALSGLLAFIGASCCVLPILLVGMGVSSGVVAQLGVFVQLQPWLLGAALVLIAGSFAAAYRGGRRPRPRTLAILLVGAVLVALSIGLSLYETEVLQWLNRR